VRGGAGRGGAGRGGAGRGAAEPAPSAARPRRLLTIPPLPRTCPLPSPHPGATCTAGGAKSTFGKSFWSVGATRLRARPGKALVKGTMAPAFTLRLPAGAKMKWDADTQLCVSLMGAPPAAGALRRRGLPAAAPASARAAISRKPGRRRNRPPSRSPSRWDPARPPPPAADAANPCPTIEKLCGGTGCPFLMRTSTFKVTDAKKTTLTTCKLTGTAPLSESRDLLPALPPRPQLRHPPGEPPLTLRPPAHSLPPPRPAPRLRRWHRRARRRLQLRGLRCRLHHRHGRRPAATALRQRRGCAGPPLARPHRLPAGPSRGPAAPRAADPTPPPPPAAPPPPDSLQPRVQVRQVHGGQQVHL
jgi:hypothetical protein